MTGISLEILKLFYGKSPFSKNNGRVPSNNFRISFIGTFEFLDNIKSFFNVTNISLAKGTGKAYVLQISGRKQIMRILSILYKDSTVETRLDRKYNKFIECSSWAHRL